MNMFRKIMAMFSHQTKPEPAVSPVYSVEAPGEVVNVLQIPAPVPENIRLEMARQRKPRSARRADGFRKHGSGLQQQLAAMAKELHIT